jgi:hypothetical protein
MGGEEGAPCSVGILAGHPVDARAAVVQRALRWLDPKLREADLRQPRHGGLLGGLVPPGERGRTVGVLDAGELALIIWLDLGGLAGLAIVE